MTDYISLPAATKSGQGNVFTGVCDSVHRGGGCLPQCMLGYCRPPEQRPPPGPDPLWEQTPPRADIPPEWRPPGADTPPEQTPPRDQTPPEQTPPLPLGQDPPWEADASIRSMSGRYASYWNAFLWKIFSM